MRVPASTCLLLGLLFTSACGPTVDLTKALQVTDVSTAWFDAGIVDGQNKLVPMISFKLKNLSDQKLVAIQLNVLFRRVTEPKEEWGSGFLANPAPGGLEPGATTDTLTVKSNLGYKGTDPRESLLHNSQFIDAKVDMLAKYASTQWVRIADVVVERKLVIK